MDWLRRRERIAWELEELRAGGVDFEEPTITDGIVTVPVFVDIKDVRHRLEVDFFEFYPYFRFEVRAPSLTLDHHQHPFAKNLCLIPRATQHWDVNRSLAAQLREQLPKVLATGIAGASDDALRSEDPQAEPVTTYFPSVRSSAVFFDDAIPLPDDFTLGRITLIREPESRKQPFRGTLTEVSTLANERLRSAPAHLVHTGDRVEGYVVQLRDAILEPDASKLFEVLRRSHLHGLRTPSKTFVVAVVMPEEHTWRNQNGRGWLFIVHEQGRNPYFARPMRAGAADLRARAPELAGLEAKAIAHFGLGCIGAQSAVEFAKAGVGRLRLVDHDIVDAGTVMRWYLGLPTSGYGKTDIIANFIRSNYPITKVDAVLSARIGATEGERGAIERLIDGVDLVYDAMAESGVSYFLADLARHAGVPYVGVSGTQGGWGGNVMRLRSDGRTGCWYCLERAKDEKQIPPAPHDGRSDVQPAGCADPTFTGAGFDLATIALTGVRTAIATLLEGADGYPAAPSDVTVIALRDTHGRLIQPEFAGYDLPPYPDCPACSTSGSR